MSYDLFDSLVPALHGTEQFASAADPVALNPELHQWFTPAWAAEAIIEQEFGWLRAGHRVLEPSCGDGAFLVAIPPEVDAIGVDIDPVQAALAAASTGRKVLVGDFTTMDAELIGKVDLVVGNPPFQSDIVQAFIERSAELLPEGGQVGLILPGYIFQTSSRVELLSRNFSIHQQMLPRNLFPRLKLPLMFARFVKEQHRKLYGFLLYREAQEMRELNKEVVTQASAARDPRGAWHQVVTSALRNLGGEASLGALYEHVAKNRPTENPFWKEKIRQVCQRSSHFVRVAPGRYALTGT